MILFMVGDFKTDTGPSVANRMMRSGLSGNKNILYSDANGKISRIIELFFKIRNSDCVCFCSSSKLNRLGIKLAKFLKKRSFYLMHGYSTYEYQQNVTNPSPQMIEEKRKFEQYIFENCDKVFCVSEKFMEFMKSREPNFIDKFDYNYNGVDINEIEEIASLKSNQRYPKQIISLGGGIPQKNNAAICEAIEKLNRDLGIGLKYIVIGSAGRDKEKISTYEFVTYYDKLPHKEVLTMLSESSIYIQNSNFETFGLTIIEALYAGCSILLSSNIGVVDLMTQNTEYDLILDNNDIDEIAKKILHLLEHENSNRMIDGLDTSEITNNVSGNKLYNKILKEWKN